MMQPTILNRGTRRMVLAGLGVLGPALLAACGAGGTASPSAGSTGNAANSAAKSNPTTNAAPAAPAPAKGNAPAATKKNVTIKVTARQTPEQDMWPVRVPAFQEKYPNIKIETDLHGGNIVEKISALIAAGDIGDVVHTHFSSAQPQNLFLGGSMRNLDPFIAKDKLDLKQWYLQAIDAGRVEGKVVAMPFKGKMATVAVFLNQTLFEQAGVPLPDLNTSVNDISEMAVKLTKPDGSQWGMATAGLGSARNLTGVLRRWNAELFSKDQKKATLDTEEARAAFQWIYDALHKRRFLADNGDALKMFNQGQVAMLVHYDFNSKTTIQPASEAQGFKYTATLAPKGPTGRRGDVWIPDGMQVSTTSQNPDEAWLVLKWFTDHDTGLSLALQQSQGSSTTPGARPDVYGDPQFINNPAFPKLLQELDRDANLLPENYQGMIPANFKIPEANDVIKKAVDQVWKNEAEPTPSFLKAVNGDLQNVLDMPR